MFKLPMSVIQKNKFLFAFHCNSKLIFKQAAMFLFNFYYPNSSKNAENYSLIFLFQSQMKTIFLLEDICTWPTSAADVTWEKNIFEVKVGGYHWILLE